MPTPRRALRPMKQSGLRKQLMAIFSPTMRPLVKITSSSGKVHQVLKTRRKQEADLVRGLRGSLSSLFIKTRKP